MEGLFDITENGFVIKEEGEGISLYDVYKAFGLPVGNPMTDYGDMRDIIIHDGRWCRKVIKSIKYDYEPIFK